MSQFKKSLESGILKEKFSTLLKSLDRTNTSKMIIERQYGELCSLEIAEGTSTAIDVQDELKGIGVEQNKVRHLITASIMNEKRTTVADQFLLQRVAILEKSCKELGAYSWMKPVGTFINETQEFLKRNELNILIERVIFDLEVDKNVGYYKKAIVGLSEASKSENPIYVITETMEDQKWIPLVKKLYEYCSKLKGAVNGQNPNFKVSKIYSPIEFLEEKGTYTFYSNGKVLETDGSTIMEFEGQVSENFKSLVSITESAKFGNGVIRLYPNPSSVVDVDFNGESPKVVINNKVVESSNVESFMLASGFLKYTEKNKAAQIMHAISEGNNIKELDFGYHVNSSLFEGVSVNVFNLNENIYIQKINKGMKENSFILAESAEDAVSIVKDFMNYDISNSLTHLLETENSERIMREKELDKVQSRIKFLMESLGDLERVAKINGVENSTQIVKAKELLESQIALQNNELAKITSKDIVNESALEIAGGVILGILGIKTIAAIFKQVLGRAQLKSVKDPAKLKTLASELATKAMAEGGKNPLQCALWNNTVNTMIEKGDIKNAYELAKTFTAMDKIDVKDYFESEGFDLESEEIINENCTPGKEYKIKGESGWVYQGETDGKHIFNNDKGGKEPITYDIKGFEAAHKTKEIAECGM